MAQGDPAANLAPKPVASPRTRFANRWSQTLARALSLALAMGITAIIFIFRDQLRHLSAYGYLGIFLISLAGNATVILPVPTFLAAFAGGSIFHPILVGVIAAAGAAIGELTGYLAGVAGQAVVENREMYDRLEQLMRRYGLMAVFVLAATPNPLFDVAGIISGALRLPVHHFLISAWAGKTVKFLAIAYLGAGSAQLFEQLMR